MELSDLRGMYAGETVWVFGSGPTLNFIDPQFFADKVTVATNLGPVQFGVKRPTFVFSHYHSEAAQTLALGLVAVTLACDTNTQRAWEGDIPDNLVLVPQDSYVGPGDGWNPNSTHRPRSDSLVYGSSSLHGAMHLAAWVGAAHIVMVGADCCGIDGQWNFDGYNSFVSEAERGRITSLYERDHRRMKQYLVDTYGVGVYSLNPFINLNLEGHELTRPDGRY